MTTVTIHNISSYLNHSCMERMPYVSFTVRWILPQPSAVARPSERYPYLVL